MPANFMDIYTEYIRLRQTGASMEIAIKALQGHVDQLDQSERSQLNLLVRQWETRESNSFLLEQAKGGSTPAKKSSVIRPINAAGSPQTAQPVTGFGEQAPEGKVFCSQCGKQNRAKDKYCFSCGSLLQSPTHAPSGATKGLTESSGDPRDRLGTAYFGQTSKLLLIIRGSSIPVEVTGEVEVVIGRSSPDSPMKPDIDLAPFDAENLGVSRLHVSLNRDEYTVHVTDLSSRNHTFINGQRLHPREVRVLRDGDEIRLGRLTLKVVFRH
ncbi:MAG: FHA domain-containing protein [Anaerolinea sp.]|nr:FHA domain-containing protein [Anaerolinea sp.]MCC6976355.1 FHA domain-containing protein [Anaerolineae bacterium]CAG0954430.1 hypothetical protein ANRL4_00286 [Anaerolineae bacterium]